MFSKDCLKTRISSEYREKTHKFRHNTVNSKFRRKIAKNTQIRRKIVKTSEFSQKIAKNTLCSFKDQGGEKFEFCQK